MSKQENAGETLPTITQGETSETPTFLTVPGVSEANPEPTVTASLEVAAPV